MPQHSASHPHPDWFCDLAAGSHDVFFRYRLRPSLGADYLIPRVIELTGYTVEAFLSDPVLFRRLVHPNDRGLLDAVEDGAENSTISWVAQPR